MMKKMMALSMMAIFSSPVIAAEMHEHKHAHVHEHAHEKEHEHVQHAMPAETSETQKAVIPTPSAEDIARAFPNLTASNNHAHGKAGVYTLMQINRLEWMRGGGSAWAGDYSWGSAFNRMGVSSSGLREEGSTHEAEVQLYGSHAFNAWWSAVGGVAVQNGFGPSRGFATLGVQGEAEDFIETAATLYLGSHGQAGLALELGREFLLTNRLILEPELELVYWHKADPARLLGKGFSEIAPGFQLRYEIQREFAPYIGMEWHRKLSNTAKMRRAAGEESSELHTVIGLRLWW